jgi:hypothetical protein
MCWMRGRVLWLRWSSGSGSGKEIVVTNFWGVSFCYGMGFQVVLGVLFLLGIWDGVFSFLQLRLAKACILFFIVFCCVAPILYPSMVFVLE